MATIAYRYAQLSLFAHDQKALQIISLLLRWAGMYPYESFPGESFRATVVPITECVWFVC